MKKADIVKRLTAFFIDYIIYMIIFLVPTFIIVFSDFFDENSVYKFFNYFHWFMLVLVVAISLKDIFGGRSIGKRIFKLYVRSCQDAEKTPKFYSLIIRNLFLLIWPIEFIIIVIGKNNRRLGDRIANTQVVEKA